ncbi:TonB-dependent siderophore receptor (plasmid) [Aliirhizobium terrae]|uniref:TonB-dependent siderophore receptor n=1 Tax=Terrirhizobium terrae TaxID=2926709 RepID=UPI00257566EF|nr:TonB-dependent siderophore receptor [Rhizobium sp. CC-CFT758]WJH38033.1 TonB-dependent siderophore receptor [Rhizobium sp. CC-CFT758]
MDMETTGGTTKRSLKRYRKAILLGCTALVALAPRFAIGQEAEAANSDTTLAPIVIQGTGNVLDTSNDSNSIVATQTTVGSGIPTDILVTPASVSIVTAKEIQERAAQDLEQILQYTPGVTTDFYGTDDRFDYVRIRGFDAFVYRDGIAVGDPFGGIREEPYAYERVEVLKGANSTIFGVADPGGSINYVSKRPKSERFGEVYATGGSFSHKEAGFDFGDNITEDDTLSYRLTGKVRDADTEYDYGQNNEKFFMGGLTWRPTDVTSLTVTYDHLNKDGSPGAGGHPVNRDLDRELFLGEPDYNYDDTNRNTVSVMFDHDFGNGLSFGSTARYSKSNTGFGYAYISGDPVISDTLANRDYYGNRSSEERFIINSHLKYDFSADQFDSTTLAGFEYSKTDSDGVTYYMPADPINWADPVYFGAPDYPGPYSTERVKQNTKAIYAQQNFTFDERLTVSLGARNDWMDISRDDWNAFTGASASETDLSEFTKRVGVSYKVTDEIAPYASYSESVAPPTNGNKPERGRQYEIGVKYQPEAFPALFTASVFDLTKNDISYTNPNPPFTETTTGEVRVRGFELEAKAEITNNISLTAAYAYLDGEIVENAGVNEGNTPERIPEHQASAWVNYTVPANGFLGDMTFGFGGRYMSSYYFSDANTSKTDSSVIFDAAFSYKIRENTTFQLNATNLFDEKHVAQGGFGSEYYNPGRAIYATLRQTW